jgi:hypothetical protein
LRHNTVRPDAVGTDQPQPVDALGVAEVHIPGDAAAVHGDNMDQPERVGKGVWRLPDPGAVRKSAAVLVKETTS